MPDEQIASINSLLTIVDGKVVYGGGDFEHIVPKKLTVIPDWSPVKYYGGFQR